MEHDRKRSLWSGAYLRALHLPAFSIFTNEFYVFFYLCNLSSSPLKFVCTVYFADKANVILIAISAFALSYVPFSWVACDHR